MRTLSAHSLVPQVNGTCGVGRHSSYTCTTKLTYQSLHRELCAAGRELRSKDAEAEV